MTPEVSLLTKRSTQGPRRRRSFKPVSCRPDNGGRVIPGYNLIVYGGYLLVCRLLHWRVANATHLLWLAAGGVAYHFVFESRGGQTLGKRRYGIRVVDADGGPAGPRAVAIRSVLRIIDSLPVCYVSGLLSMVRTGPARRQRIGDIAAGTIVVAVDGRAASQGTPRWLLPVATIAAVIVSALSIIGIAEARHQPRSMPWTT